MTTKLYLDTRTKGEVTEETEFPVKIAINHAGSSAYISTGIRVRKDQWKAKLGQVVEHPYRARYNLMLAEKKLRVDRAIEELRVGGGLHGASASGIKEAVEKFFKEQEGGGDGKPDEALVVDVLREHARRKERARTVGSLLGTARKVEAFAPGAVFSDITPAWLAEFDSWMAQTSPSVNARAVHMRNLKTAFNDALDEGLTRAPYPFKRFKIRRAPTRDRSLSAETLRAVAAAECTPAQEKYRDLFLLSFYLCGINLADLLALRRPKHGRSIEFVRIKTGQPISLTIPQEAIPIINKYKGTGDLLINFGERYTNYSNLLHRINDHLKMIGMVYNPRTKKWEGKALFPDLSYYWARYSWATLAAELDVPERTTGAALGHSTAKSVTSIYIRVDMRKKVDEANRKVIDYVFGNKK